MGINTIQLQPKKEIINTHLKEQSIMTENEMKTPEEHKVVTDGVGGNTSGSEIVEYDRNQAILGFNDEFHRKNFQKTRLPPQI
mmetsp:Transcript_35890/g.34946  ORF Transcript_35890/g.34946 Transcript_35890/m.34946 type:complete len:83 (+) Transcript_35890:315-563(+)